MIDIAEDIRHRLSSIEQSLTDLKFQIESLDDDLFNAFEDEEIFDNLQLAKSHINSAIKELERAIIHFEDVYDDIHYYEFEKMKEEI